MSVAPRSKRFPNGRRHMTKTRRISWHGLYTPHLTLTFFCCLLYLLVCFSVTANWHFPSSGSRHDRELHKHIDVIGIAVKPTCVTKRAVEGLNLYLGPRRIIVVTSSERACEIFRSFAANVECYAEQELLPTVTKTQIRDFLEGRYGGMEQNFYRGRDNAGWYLQQFLKLGVAEFIPDLSSYYVLWDLDMILLKQFNIFYQSRDYGRQTILNIGGVNSEGYDSCYQNLTGTPLQRAPDGSSFVTHSMVVHKPIMLEFLAYLSSLAPSEPIPEGPRWIWAIVAALNPEYLHIGFSEYASYATWLLTHHKETVHMMTKKTWSRHPVGGVYSLSWSRYFSEEGLCCPTDGLMATMKTMQFQYSGFEIGHNDKCKYNDPKYADGYGV